MAKSQRQKFWQSQIQKAQKRAEKWHTSGEKVVKIYRRDPEREGSQFNILWTNTEILKPAVLSRVSGPHITRRFKDESPVALEVAETLERTCKFIHDEDEFSEALKNARDDFLLPGRGVVRYKYKARFQNVPMDRTVNDEVEAFAVGETILDPDGFIDEEDRDSAFIEQKVAEEIIPEYVHWKDFLMSNSRTWGETWWIAFRHGMAEDELIDMFGEDKVNEIKLPKKTEKDSEQQKRTVFEVWEIWDKRRAKRVWIATDAQDTFEIEDAPLDLKDFYPIPSPLLPFKTNDTTTPVPLYSAYQDQAEELDVVVGRLTALTRMFKIAGYYDAAGQEIIDLEGLEDGEFKPIQGASEFRANGGFAGSIFGIPIADIAAAIDKLSERRDSLKAEIFELTGIADIMRGHTDPGEGVGTQRIKATFGTLRLRPLREPMEDFIKESYEIISEIAADKFDPETFAALTGKAPSPEAMALMRNDRLRGFRIDVETDSTVIPNEEIDRRNATEFLSAISGFMATMLPVVQAQPQLAPMAIEMMKFGSRQFKAGRGLEDVITKTLDDLAEAAKAPPPPQPPSDAQIKADSQSETNQVKVITTRMQEETKRLDQESDERISEGDNRATIIANQLDVLAANPLLGGGL